MQAEKNEGPGAPASARGDGRRATARAAWALGGVGAALLVAYALLFRRFYIDDVYIHLRYASHWLQGLGFRFNRDEPPVLGTSSPLWVVLLAVPVRLLPADPLPLVKVLGLLLSATALATLARAVRDAGARWLPTLEAGCHRFAGAVTIFLLLVSGRYWLHVFSGMEAPLYALLFAAVAGILARRGEGRAPGRAGTALGLGCMLLFLARPEGGAAFAAVPLALVADRAGRRRALVAFAITGAALVLAWIAYATATFGSPVPTSVAAKGGNLPLLSQPWGPALRDYASQLANPYGPTLVAGGILTVTAAFVAGRKLLAWARQPLTVFNLVYGSLVVLGYLAANARREERYLTLFGPVLVLLFAGPSILVAGRLATAMPTRWRQTPRLALLSAAVAVASFLPARSIAEGNAKFFHQRYDPLKSLASEIRRDAAGNGAPGRPTVLLETVGVLAYFTGADVLDIAGLVSPELTATSHLAGGSVNTGGPSLPAQRRAIRAAIRARRPEFIVLKQIQYQTFLEGMFDDRRLELIELGRTPPDATGWGQFIAWRARYGPSWRRAKVDRSANQ